MLGVVICGVVSWGVVTGPTVTVGTVTVGTLTDGTDTVGSPSDAALPVAAALGVVAVATSTAHPARAVSRERFIGPQTGIPAFLIGRKSDP